MSKTSSSYIPVLDGLRGISILLVFVAHLGFDKFVPGGLGVTVFFFISGYIITNLLIDEHCKTGFISLKLFYTRRLLRLYPPLIIMVIGCIIYCYYIGQPASGYQISAALFYYENYYSLYGQHVAAAFGVLWSLAVEEHFYLLFPFIFILFFKKPKVLFTILTLLIILPLAFRFMGHVQYKNHPDEGEWYCYALTHTRFDSILYGCLTSFILYFDSKNRFLDIIAKKPVFALGILVLLLSLVLRNPLFRNTIRYSAQGLALAIIVPALVKVRGYKWLCAIVSNKPLVFVGRLSYSVYLFHYVIFEALKPQLAAGHKANFYVGAIVFTAVSSLLSFYLIEQPIGKLRKKFRHVNHPSAPVL